MTAMLRRSLLTAGLLLVLCLASGCWDFRNVRDMDYVSAIGFDFKDGQYAVYVQLVDFATTAKSDGALPAGSFPVWIGKGTGKTLDTAVQDLYATAQKRLFWGHVTAVVYSDRMIAKGITPTFDLLNRFREVRYAMWVFGTADRIDDLFAVSPFFNMSPLDLPLHNPNNTYRQSSRIRPLSMQKLLRLYYDEGTTVLMPRLNLRDGKWGQNKQYLQMLAVSGAYAIDADGASAHLSDQALVGLRWTEKRTVRAPIVVGKDGRPAAVLSLVSPEVKITSRMTEQGKPTFDMQVRISANITEMMERASLSYMQKEAAAAVKRQIRHTYRKGLEAGKDVYNLEHQFYRRHNRAWHALLRDGPFRLTPESLARIEVEVAIKDMGKYNLEPPG